MKEKMKQYKKYIEYGLFTLIIVTLTLGIYYLFKTEGAIFVTVMNGVGKFIGICSPMIYAFAFAYVLYKPMRLIEQKLLGIGQKGNKQGETSERKKMLIRIVSIIIVFASVMGILWLLLSFLVPPIIDNLEKFVTTEAQMGQSLNNVVSEVKAFVSELKQNANILVNPTHSSAKFVELVTGIVGNIGSFVIDAIAAVILTFYFLKDKERLFKAIDRGADVVFSTRVKRYVKVVIDDIDEIIGGFIIGTIFAGIVVCVISSSLMFMIGHPFALLIGVVAGVMNMVPYVGPLVGAVLALVLGILDSVTLGITGFILLILYQQVDGNFIEPKIVGDKIGLPAVWILIVVIIGGSYWGGVGMILSAPVAALIKVYIDRIYNYKKEKGLLEE